MSEALSSVRVTATIGARKRSTYVKKRETRSRWHIKDEDHAVLEHALSVECFPNREVISSISCILGVSERNVRVWFQNRRQRRKPRVVDSDIPLGHAALLMIVLQDLFPLMRYRHTVLLAEKFICNSPQPLIYIAAAVNDYTSRKTNQEMEKDSSLTFADAHHLVMFSLLWKVTEVMAS